MEFEAGVLMQWLFFLAVICSFCTTIATIGICILVSKKSGHIDQLDNYFFDTKTDKKHKTAKIEVKFANDNATMPTRATIGSAGFDITSIEDKDIPPMSIVLIRTGLMVAIPSGYEMQLRPRSGMALKNGITLLNTPATIDSDYRGEVGVILANISKKAYQVSKGDKICQGVVAALPNTSFIQVLNFTDKMTGRGDKGYGSTGR